MEYAPKKSAREIIPEINLEQILNHKAYMHISVLWNMNLFVSKPSITISE